MGLVPRLVSELYVNIACDFDNVYEVSVAMFQIYNEEIDDLLEAKKQNLRVNVP